MPIDSSGKTDGLKNSPCPDSSGSHPAPRTTIDLDLRLFRRHRAQTTLSVGLRTGVFRAILVDYSLIGLGVLLEDSEAPVQKGDSVAVGIDSTEPYQLGKVAWTAKTECGLRIGILKTDPFKGRLDLYSLPDILIGLERTMKTGVLEIRSQSVCKKIFIRNGEIICASSNYEKDRVGDLLFKNRKINRKQYDKAAEMKKKTGSCYFTILLHMGYISSEELVRARQLQMRKIINGLFLMKDAEFEFIEDIAPPEDDWIVNLPIADVIYRSMKKRADPGLIETYLLDSVVDVTPHPLNLFRNLTLPPFDKSVLGRADGKRSIGEIVRLSAARNLETTLKVIHALLETRVLRITHKTDAIENLKVGEPGIKTGSDPLTDNIERMYSSYEMLDYYRVLGVRQDAPSHEIKKGYLQAERMFHPDMYPLVDPGLKKKIVDIFTYIWNAFLTLSDPVKRSEYDARLRGKTGGTPESAAAQKIGELPPEIAGNGAAEPSKDWETGNQETWYEPGVLDSEPLSGLEFFESISAINPEGVSEQEEEQENDFGLLRQNPVLHSETWQTKEFAPGDRLGTGEFEKNEEKARLRFRDGKVAFWEKDFVKAARFFAAALKYDASVADCHYFYGCSLRNLKKHKKAAQALNRANELRRRDPAILTELGQVYLELGFPLRAKGYFEQALKIDPSNQKAKDGLRKTGKT